MFGDIGLPAEKPRQTVASHVQPWPLSEKLGYEKELLGFYVTGHPLDEYRAVLENGKLVPISGLIEVEDKTEVTIGGALVNVDRKFTKKDGKPFAVVVLEDLTGSLEVMIWGEAFNKGALHLEKGRVVTISGRVDKRGEDAARMVAQEVAPLKTGEKPVVLTLPRENLTENDLFSIERALRQSPGGRAVVFQFLSADGNKLRMNLGPAYRVNWTPELKEQLSNWLPAAV